MIKEIIGIGDSLAGRLLMYDGLATSFYELKLAWKILGDDDRVTDGVAEKSIPVPFEPEGTPPLASLPGRFLGGLAGRVVRSDQLGLQRLDRHALDDLDGLVGPQGHGCYRREDEDHDAERARQDVEHRKEGDALFVIVSKVGQLRSRACHGRDGPQSAATSPRRGAG